MLRFEVARVPGKSDKIHSLQKKGDFNSPWWFWWGHHFSQSYLSDHLSKNTSNFRAKQRDMIRSNMLWLSDILTYVDVLKVGDIS